MSHFLPIYIRNCDLVIMCFKVDNEASLKWLDAFWARDDFLMPQCIIVATQSDLVSPAAIASAEKVARTRFGLEQNVAVTSSKDGSGVADLVERIYAFLESKPLERSTEDLPRIKWPPRTSINKKCCVIQ